MMSYIWIVWHLLKSLYTFLFELLIKPTHWLISICKHQLNKYTYIIKKAELFLYNFWQHLKH